MNPPLLGMTWLHYFLAAAIVIVCMLLVIIILLQKGRGGGLSGAFGGGGGSGSAFGAKTGDVFTWITVAFVCLYFLLNIAGNYQFRQAVAPVKAGIGAPATEAGADGLPGEDGDSAPLAGEEGLPAQPAGGEGVRFEIQPADPPAEGKSDDQAGGDLPDSPQPKPDSP